MLLSIANSRPRNIESVQTESLYPDAIKESAKNLINFIERYYEHLNLVGLPSNEIASITREKDIDIVSDKYLTQIQSLIARNIPNSRVLDKVTLYRIIIQYYHTRGSEDSIHTFFKIFFDEIIEIYYPKNHLFDLSGGSGYWHPIDIDSLRKTATNPNKNNLSITSDYKIGSFPDSNLGPYTVELRAFSKNVWTYGGVEESYNLPYVKKVNVSEIGQPAVYRWVYSYQDFELYSSNDTEWPDQAEWDILSRNIEFTNNIEGTALLESGAISILENGSVNLLEYATDLASNTKNIRYDTLDITIIPPTVDPQIIIDEFTAVPLVSSLWTFNSNDISSSTINGFKITTSDATASEISWGDSTAIATIQSGVATSHTYTPPIVASTFSVQPPTSDSIVNYFVDESLEKRELTTEKIIITGEDDVDISQYGLVTEGSDYLIVERNTDPDDNTIIVEAAVLGNEIISTASKNIEYYHIFTVKSFAEYTTKIGDLVHSLEYYPVETVYRCEDLSPVTWNIISSDEPVWTYTDNKSFASDLYKLHDGYYWQKYSYEIKSQLPYEKWGDDYLRFVHPSGLKLFSAILYEFIARTEWKDVIDYAVLKPQENYAWLNSYRPPVLGYHTPESQPGWLTGNERLLSIIIELLKDRNAPDSLIRMIRIVIDSFAISSNYRDKTIYEDYQRWLKFSDPNELISGFSHKTISQANERFAPNRSRLFSNTSSFISYDRLDLSYYPWFYSQLILLDPRYEDTDLKYDEATIDAFDIDMTDYMNSTLEDKDPLIYRYPFVTQDSNVSDELLTEDDQNSFITEGQTNVQAASVQWDLNNVLEGESIRFYITTNFIKTGTKLYYTISGTDMVSTTGEFIVKNNRGVFRLAPILDNSVTNSRGLKMTLRKGSTSGPILFSSENDITVTHNPNLPVYSIASDKNVIVEGEFVTFTVSSNMPDGSDVYYTVTNSSDLRPRSGIAKVIAGTATITIKGIIDNLVYEGDETFILRLHYRNVTDPPIAISSPITLLNAYPFWAFNSNKATINNFSVTTTDSSQTLIVWDDSSSATTLASGATTSHTYTI